MDKGEAQLAQTEKANRADERAQERIEANQAKADDNIAATPSPAVERGAQGDWAKVNNPSPQEQAEETRRTAAINRKEVR